MIPEVFLFSLVLSFFNFYLSKALKLREQCNCFKLPEKFEVKQYIPKTKLKPAALEEKV